ncbi:hypothetical protein OXYTRIMIC_736 [Oxytricha trifallax]|uniref:Protein kinase domain-containing protein n=1 Tax=Oxytricha trifallax TaxID=1172189 RepID=A0A073IB89_9SPIT|nr:hypothetical protein OXYTRIMIC_736 [Oxytricha trifallax]
MIPVFHNLRYMAQYPSPIKQMGTHFYGKLIFKQTYYRIQSELRILDEPHLQINLSNDYAISKKAKDLGFQNVVGLEHLLKGEHHLGLAYQVFLYSYYDYLCFNFHSRKSKQLCLGILNGLKELNNLGQTHRILNPKNLVIDLYPLEKKIVNFEKSRLHSNKSLLSFSEDISFMPLERQFTEEDPLIDHYACATMIIQTYICKDFSVSIESQEKLIEQSKKIKY